MKRKAAFQGEMDWNRLHNMSAPPRMKITLKPQSIPFDEKADSVAQKRAGIQLLGVVSFSQLVQDELGEMLAESEQGRRLQCLHLLEQILNYPRSSAECTDELVFDRFSELMKQFQPLEQSLPAFAFAVALPEAQRRQQLISVPADALVLLAHLSGNRMFKMRSSHLPSDWCLKEPVGFFIPQSKGGGDEK